MVSSDTTDHPNADPIYGEMRGYARPPVADGDGLSLRTLELGTFSSASGHSRTLNFGTDSAWTSSLNLSFKQHSMARVVLTRRVRWVSTR